MDIGDGFGGGLPTLGLGSWLERCRRGRLRLWVLRRPAARSAVADLRDARAAQVKFFGDRGHFLAFLEHRENALVAAGSGFRCQHRAGHDAIPTVAGSVALMALTAAVSVSYFASAACRLAIASRTASAVTS